MARTNLTLKEIDAEIAKLQQQASEIRDTEKASVIARMKEAIAYCESIADYASRDLLREILCSEEDHIDWLETQLSLIEAVGLQNYLQSQMDE